MRLYRFFYILALFSFLLTSCNKFSKVQKSKDYNFKLAKAEEYYTNKKYRFAQQLFEELFPILKGTEKFEDLYYKYAYCFYYDGLYREAEGLFKDYLEVFPNSPKAEEVDYMRAYCYYKQSPKIELEQVNTMRAIGMMQTFINMHPGSSRINEATEIIDYSRQKLELKEERGAKLYFNIGEFRAAAIAYNQLLNNYPESTLGDYYKLMAIKSYFKFAKLSITTKQEERFEKVTTEFNDFIDRFPDSKFYKEAEELSKSSINQIKIIKNEQTSSSLK
jgi:outer membrane protein assembly factor BamD